MQLSTCSVETRICDGTARPLSLAGLGLGTGAAEGSLVETGDYLVSLTMDAETMRRGLRVERVSGGRSGGVAFEEYES